MEQLIASSGTAKLAVTRHGAGQSLVFLHAGVADRRSWHPLIDALPKKMGGIQSITYDRRGFGDSTFAEERHSRVGDCVAVLDTCKLSSAVLIGNSQGGRIAIDTALLHPSRVRALVLIGTAISGAPDIDFYPPQISEFHRNLDTAETAADLGEINRLEAHLWLDGPFCVEGRVTGAVRDLFLDMNLRALQAINVGEATDDIDAWKNLSKIQIPVLVINGQFDLPHILERSARIAEVFPDAELVTMENVAHLPALEGPTRCAEIIARFLERREIV